MADPVFNTDLLRLQSRLGILGFADSTNCGTGPERVMSGLKLAMERAGAGVVVTLSEELGYFVFSLRPLDAAEFKRWEVAMANVPTDCPGWDGRLHVANRYEPTWTDIS
jgi:hypothetical protein